MILKCNINVGNRLPRSKFDLLKAAPDLFFFNIMIAAITMMLNRANTPILIPSIVNFKSD